jgi:5S rRNA maturation endonuclease (ribonuclease M5)
LDGLKGKSDFTLLYIMSYFARMSAIRLKEVKDVVIAFDRDRAGQEMTQRIQSQLPQAVCKEPKAIDWNQDLVNTFDWANKNHSQEIKQQQQRGIERGGGLSL